MCTAVAFMPKDLYFGRTLDYEFSYGETVTVTPRRFPLLFANGACLEEHYALIGMAHVADGYPLYYDAVNEKGLCMAGLNFVGNACYFDRQDGRDNVAPFECIPWILGQCADIAAAKSLLYRMSLWQRPFNADLPLAQLHWLIADRTGAITVESTRDGLFVYDNPVGVLTNNPPFPMQLFALGTHMHLSPAPPKNTFSDQLDLQPYSRGMGALGLPGDLSSQSRFIRAAFVRMNAVSGEDEASGVSQFFHILGAVEQPRGCCRLENGKCEISIYTSCCNADKGIYYYKTYDRHAVVGVDMHREDLNGSALVSYPLLTDSGIELQN